MDDPNGARLVFRTREERLDGTARIEERELAGCTRQELLSALCAPWDVLPHAAGPGPEQRRAALEEAIVGRLRRLRFVVEETREAAGVRRCSLRLEEGNTPAPRPSGAEAETPASGTPGRPVQPVAVEGGAELLTQRDTEGVIQARHTGLLVWDQSLNAVVRIALQLNLHLPPWEAAPSRDPTD